jgi:hypothetical protein
MIYSIADTHTQTNKQQLGRTIDLRQYLAEYLTERLKHELDIVITRFELKDLTSIVELDLHIRILREVLIHFFQQKTLH